MVVDPRTRGGKPLDPRIFPQSKTGAARSHIRNALITAIVTAIEEAELFKTVTTFDQVSTSFEGMRMPLAVISDSGEETILTEDSLGRRVAAPIEVRCYMKSNTLQKTANNLLEDLIDTIDTATVTATGFRLWRYTGTSGLSYDEKQTMAEIIVNTELLYYETKAGA